MSAGARVPAALPEVRGADDADSHSKILLSVFRIVSRLLVSTENSAAADITQTRC